MQTLQFSGAMRGASRLCLALALLCACGGRAIDDGSTEIAGTGGATMTGGSATMASGGVAPAPAPAPGAPCVGEVADDANRTVVAVFNESASTNADPYVYCLHSDGSAFGNPILTGRDVALTGGAIILPPGTPEVLACLDRLQQVGDVSQIPIAEFCGKSVSFGTATTVTQDGHTSGDLRCAEGTDGTNVRRDCERFIGG